MVSTLSSYLLSHPQLDHCDNSQNPLFLQFLLKLSRRGWERAMTCNHMAAATPSSAARVGFPCRLRSSGSGCPKRTVRRPSSTSPSLSQCVCVQGGVEGPSELPFCVCAQGSQCFFITHCQQVVDSEGGIAPFVMLTKTRGETMRVHSDPMQISGCDSCRSQCPFLGGRKLFRLRMCLLNRYTIRAVFV